MSESPPPLPSRVPRLLAGMILGNVAAAVQFAGVITIARQYSATATWIRSPSLFFVGMTAGFVASIIWRRLVLTAGQSALHSLTGTAIAMAGAFVAFHEGAICILMASPIYYFLFAAGAEIGRRWLKRDNTAHYGCPAAVRACCRRVFHPSDSSRHGHR